MRTAAAIAARASALMAPDAPITVPGREIVGFENCMRWYAERRAAMSPSFRYEVVDLLGSRSHAVAIIDLVDGSRVGRQVAVYRIDGGLIRSITPYESAPDPEESFTQKQRWFRRDDARSWC